MEELEKKYNHSKVEENKYDKWLKKYYPHQMLQEYYI